MKLDMDPIELRRINDTKTDPIDGRPYSSRSLMTCYDQAAQAFGWQRRDRQPGSDARRRLARRLGLRHRGLSDAYRPPPRRACAFCRTAMVRVQTAAHEIGNGAYTVIGQTAAERLGVPLARVSVELGDTNLPPAPVAGGSRTTASTCSAVLKACDAIRDKLFRAAITANDGPLAGRNAADLTLAQGRVVAAGAEEKLEDAFRRLGANAIEEYAEFVPHGMKPDSIKALYAGQSLADRRPRGRETDVCARRRIRRGTDPCADARNPRPADRRRLRGRADPEPTHGAQPAHGRNDLGHQLGPARGNRDRHASARAMSTTTSRTTACR